MNSLKFKFFIIFIILGSVLAVIGYIPYMNYITYSYTTVVQQILVSIENQQQVLRDIDRVVALGENAREYCDVDEETYNKAISGEYGEEVWGKIREFEALNRRLFNLRRAFNLEFVSYMQVLPNNEYRYLLSSDFSYKWLETWGLNDLLHPNYSSEELGHYIDDAVATNSFRMSDESISQKGWGNIVPAFLPITNDDGVVVGVLEADYKLESVFNFRKRALYVLGVSILLAAVASVLLSSYVSVSLVRPIKELKNIATSLANKDFSVNVLKFRKDELGEMQKAMIVTRDNLRRALSELQEERDEITTMKDSLKTGIFMVNINNIIQARYSKAMEEIFGMKNLFGKPFVSLLEASFNDGELASVNDFFEMIISGSLKQKKIDSLNPLFEFRYVNPETKAEKTLRCGFSRIQREDSGIFILGTAEDVSAEFLLKKRLAQEEKVRTEQMRLMFEVVNLDQNILRSFLSDVEYNFNKIIELQKTKKNNPKVMLLDIYQVVHATKSDAAILGLSIFAEKLHEIEEEIKRLTSLKNIDFTEMLRFTVGVESIMRERDKITEILSKINAVTETAKPLNEAGLLEESLVRAASRVAGDLNKKVAFVNAGIDNDVYKKAPRRELKDILVQIVRNAVYHGIETPEERVKAGKPEEGKITVSIKAEKEMLHVSLADDGCGLDFQKIRAKALEKKLISEADAADDKKVLEVIFEPAFSTASREGMHAGRGIGLNLVRDRVQQLNGSVKVKSKTEKGTEFHIYIPLKTGQ
ncbi:MAG: HAMP domain-containing protein [Spirochaetaceae bacterium]|jgi:two-component system chemotaxis sensor kinase CheA|nr:HAMP domain-containing protein [Spirochaetaceae bacterium]